MFPSLSLSLYSSQRTLLKHSVGSPNSQKVPKITFLQCSKSICCKRIIYLKKNLTGPEHTHTVTFQRILFYFCHTAVSRGGGEEETPEREKQTRSCKVQKPTTPTDRQSAGRESVCLHSCLYSCLSVCTPVCLYNTQPHPSTDLRFGACNS